LKYNCLEFYNILILVKANVNGIDEFQVKTKDDFDKLKELLKKKILPLEVRKCHVYIFSDNLNCRPIPITQFSWKIPSVI